MNALWRQALTTSFGKLKTRPNADGEWQFTMMKSSLLIAGSTLLALTAFAGDGTVRRSANRVPGRYVVVLEPGANLDAVTSTVRTIKGARVHRTYGKGLKGLALEMSDADARQLSRDRRVLFVEEDSVVSAKTVSWGLDRIDQTSLPLDGSFGSTQTGAGVTAYIVDTGIMAGHAEFGGRVAPGFSAFDGGTADCNGHGTHVAGIVGGSTTGVARSVTLVPVRVLDCGGSGTVSTLLSGLDWVLQNASGPSVVNMSLGGAPSSALDKQVNVLLQAGLTVVISAGNDNKKACDTSPARVAGAITVGASTEYDQRAGFSNYGACIDVFAPGANILSAYYASPTARSVASGTSSAAPFVSGVVALWLEQYPRASTTSISSAVVTATTHDVLGAVGEGSPNRLVHSTVGVLDELPPSDAQLLSDPGFEEGETYWVTDICTVVNPTGCPPIESFSSRSGNTHAAIGGPATSFSLTSETLTIPATVRAAELSFYLWVVSKNKKHSDTLAIEIRDENNVLLETLGTFTNLDVCDTYVERRFDVTRYRGKAIRISFIGQQDKGAPTWFLLDDVALNIWR